MKDLNSKIEAVLFYKNEPVSYKELSKLLDAPVDDIKKSINEISNQYQDRGITLIKTDESVCFGTSPKFSSLIEDIKKEELSRDLGRAGLETLSIVLYKGPISRREIDYIRGVNSGFILRNLMIRGLIERGDPEVGERSFVYKPTLELYKFLGISKKEDLPEYENAFKKLEEFAKTETLDQEEEKREDKETNV